MDVEEIKYCIVLTLGYGISLSKAKQVLDYSGSAIQAFASLKLLQREGLLTMKQIRELENPKYMAQANVIVNDALAAGVECIPYSSTRFPARLKQCIDPPMVLYFKGEVDLNKKRVVNIVGTRKMTSYGRSAVRKLVNELALFDSNILIVSGLAYGVDVAAHEAAIEEGLSTIGVLAHGLDRLYPSANRRVAKAMLQQGGLLTEHPFETEPERYNFVSRNRIIAGISDATIVIESAAKGGALLTADFANGYDRECFALPGRVNDTYSKGCNDLISKCKAHLLSSVDEVVKILNWDIDTVEKKRVVQQHILPANLTDIEVRILRLLETKGVVSLDDIELNMGIDISDLHTVLFKLEMEGYVQALAGNAYQLTL